MQLNRVTAGGYGRPQPLPIGGASADRSTGNDDGLQVLRYAPVPRRMKPFESSTSNSSEKSLLFLTRMVSSRASSGSRSAHSPAARRLATSPSMYASRSRTR